MQYGQREVGQNGSGRTPTGRVYEHQVEISNEEGQTLKLRRIVILLDEPTRDGKPRWRC